MSTPDELEQAMTPTGDAAPSVTPELPAEADVADVVEQATETGPAPHLAASAVEGGLPLEASEADALEQAQVVPHDEDDRPV